MDDSCIFRQGKIKETHVTIKQKFTAVTIMQSDVSASFLLQINFCFLSSFSIVSFCFRFDNAAAYAGFPVRQLTAAFLSVYHFWLMLLPLHLSCDWSHSSLELINIVGSYEPVALVQLFRAVASVAILGVFCWATLRLLVKVIKTSVVVLRFSTASKHRFGGDGGGIQLQSILKNDNQWTRKSFHAIVLTVLPFLPASNLLFTTGFTVAERVMYLPSIGFLLLMAIGVRQMFSTRCFGLKNGKGAKTTVRRLLHLGLLLLVVVFSMQTYMRSFDW